MTGGGRAGRPSRPSPHATGAGEQATEAVGRRGRDPVPFRRASAALTGVAAGATLGAALFLLAVFLHDAAFRRAPLATTPTATDPRSPVRVYAGSPREGVDVLLVPFRDDGGGAGTAEPRLDADLLPGGEPHAWYRVLATRRDGADAAHALALGGGAFSARTRDGATPSAALPEAWRARAAELPPHRRMALALLRVGDVTADVPRGGSLRALVAFPRASRSSPPPTEIRMADGTVLRALDVTAESIRVAFAAGDARRVETAAVVEARRPSGAR